MDKGEEEALREEMMEILRQSRGSLPTEEELRRGEEASRQRVEALKVQRRMSREEYDAQSSRLAERRRQR